MDPFLKINRQKVFYKKYTSKISAAQPDVYNQNDYAPEFVSYGKLQNLRKK